MDILLLKKLVTDLGGFGAQVYFKRYGGKLHIILKGYPGLRRILNAPRYGAGNVKVVKMGLGKIGALNVAKGGGILTIILIGAFRVIDFFLRDRATLTELVGTLATDVVKVGITTGVAIGAATMVAAAPFIGAFAIGPLVAVIFAGALTSVILNYLDNHYRITEKTIKALEDFEALAKAKYLQGRELILDLERYGQDKTLQLKQLPGRAADAAVETLLEYAEEVIMRYIARSIDDLFRQMTMPSL